MGECALSAAMSMVTAAHQTSETTLDTFTVNIKG